MTQTTLPHSLNSKLWKHLNIGLFGGTFNPPHEGHLHVCQTALRQKKFDFIWWMVTPQNPLKRDQSIPSFEQRMEWSQEIATHPRILVTDIERQLGTYKSIDSVKALKKRFPQTNFTFLAGTDNALYLHKWEEWRSLIKEVPFLFIARPPALNLVQNFPAKMISHSNIDWILSTKLVDQSSTNLRDRSVFVENTPK